MCLFRQRLGPKVWRRDFSLVQVFKSGTMPPIRRCRGRLGLEEGRASKGLGWLTVPHVSHSIFWPVTCFHTAVLNTGYLARTM